MTTVLGEYGVDKVMSLSEDKTRQAGTVALESVHAKRATETLGDLSLHRSRINGCGAEAGRDEAPGDRSASDDLAARGGLPDVGCVSQGRDRATGVTGVGGRAWHGQAASGDGGRDGGCGAEATADQDADQDAADCDKLSKCNQRLRDSGYNARNGFYGAWQEHWQ